MRKPASLIIDGHNAFKAIVKHIQQARFTIHIKMYMWRDDEKGREVLQSLQKKIEKTPSIKIFIEKDIFGSRVYNWYWWLSLGKKGSDIFWSKLGNEFIERNKKNVTLQYVGSKSLLFFKLLKENDHSKVFVFDRKTPYSITLIGGMNIGNEYLSAPNYKNPDMGGWHDYMVRIYGDPIHATLPKKMKKKWYETVLENSVTLLSNVVGRYRIKHEILKELRRAKKSIIVEHAYLTSEVVIRTLRQMARKGISVMIIIPDRSDGVYHANMASVSKLLRPTPIQKKKYEHLKVYLYRGMIHAKVLIIDEEVAIIGSANLTKNSFEILRESNAIFRSKEGITKKLCEQTQKDLQNSRLLTFHTIPKYNKLRAEVERWFI